MEDYTRKFGDLLRATRNQKGTSLKTIVIEMGVSGKTIEYWEQGNSLPGENKLPLIALSYGIDESELRKAYGLAINQRDSDKAIRRGLKRKFSEKSLEGIFTGSLTSRERKPNMIRNNRWE